MRRTGRGAESVHETYLATRDAVPTARRTASGWASAHGAGADTVSRIALAVSEAVANVALHAYRADPKPGLVAIDLERLGGELLLITVSDGGSGMAPHPDSPGLGLGLQLIGRLADILTFRSPPTGGTELRMQFHITDDAPAQSHRDRVALEAIAPAPFW